MTAIATPMIATRPGIRTAERVKRVSLTGAREDQLFFAQVREDPRVEIEALQPGQRDRVVVVSSGGCTALSLLASGAAEVHAVDLNCAQNHLVELKAAAVRKFSRLETLGFVGGTPMSHMARASLYAMLREHLSRGAREYWDARPMAIGGGVLSSGVSERFIRLVCWAIRYLVHTPSRVDRMLACRTLDEQRALFEREWNTRRWRGLFALLLNKWVMSRAYDKRFFERVGRANFAEHFLQLANHALTEISIADNYFVQQMLTGIYPVQHREGVPPYLGERAFATAAKGMDRLLLVDGGFTDHLRRLPDRSVNAFALSNICEWLDEAQVTALFNEVERTAAPGARVVFRNFVGWTDLPAGLSRLEEDTELGERLLRQDRAVVQSRVVVCRVR